MKKDLLVMAFLATTTLAATASHAGWHTISPVTKVTVMDGAVYIAGSNPTGFTCSSLFNLYGTLYTAPSHQSYKEQYALALTAFSMNRGLSCYISSQDSYGVCRMENCHIQ